ncbi:Ion transport protein-domain-containing protein [Gorgonomyces haynaldii]|nr:Ion transport protein-domain-containing protein [Gorgonomyces haynaldii]
MEDLDLNKSFKSLQSQDMEDFQSFSDDDTFMSYVHFRCCQIVSDVKFEVFILFFVAFNCITIAIESQPTTDKLAGYLMQFFDSVFLGIFIAEAIVRILAERMRYFTDAWNVMDFAIVLISIAVICTRQLLTSYNQQISGFIYSVRILRSLRIIRLIKSIKGVQFLSSLQLIINTLLESMPALGSIVTTGGLMLYIWAIIGTCFYGPLDPRFSSVGMTFFRLTHVVSLDTWTESYYALKDVAPSIGFYLCSFVIIMAYIFLNLVTAVIVNNLTHHAKNKKAKKKQEHVARSLDSLLSLGSKDDSLVNLLEDERKNRAHLEDFAMDQFGLDNYYSPVLPWKTKDILSSYFMYLAALESSTNLYEHQLKVLEDLVDLAQAS